MNGQSRRTDVPLNLLELEEVIWRWRELKVKEFLRKGDNVCEIEVVDLGR